jgi:CYTH domain-containing protein
MMEHERKFLVANPPGHLKRYPHDAIRQGYLAIEPGDAPAEVRIRRIDGRYTLTIKQGRGASRLEREVALSRRQGRKLWPMTRGRRIEKVRYNIPYRGLTIELDVYRGNAKGLCVAEVEFASAESLRAFEPPCWFDREVTGRRRFANSRLAKRGWQRS